MTEDYLSYFFSLPNLSPLGLLALLLLAMMRIAPVITLAPFFGSAVMPVTCRAGLAIIFSFVFLPTIVHTTDHTAIAFNMYFTLLCLKELIVGTVLGALVALPFFVFQSSGVFIDYARGASILQIQDPTMKVQSSTIGNLFNYILIVLFYELNGPFLFFEGYLKAYQIIPADGFLNSSIMTLKLPLWQAAIAYLQQLAALSLQLAAPAMLAILMTEMFLGIANRLAPQVQIAFLGLSLKSFAALLVLWAGWFFVVKQAGIVTGDWLQTIDKIISSVAPFGKQ